ncbi:hypothetical protein D9M72_541850 [compost metagenome]
MDDVEPTFWTPQSLQRAVGDHLIEIHVRGGSCAALKHIDSELVGQNAVGDVVTRRDDGQALVEVEIAELDICESRGLLHICHGTNEDGIMTDRYSGYLEVGDCPSSLRAIVACYGNIDVAERILDTSRRFGRGQHFWPHPC